MNRALISGTAGLLTGSALSLADFDYPVAARIGLALGLGCYVYLLLTHTCSRRIARARGLGVTWLRRGAVVGGVVVGVGTWLLVTPEPTIGRLDPAEGERLAQRAADLTVTRLRREPTLPDATESPEAIPPQVPQAPPLTSTDVARTPDLALYLMYAYEWNNYLGATNADGNMSRVILHDAPLRRSLAVAFPHRLDLGVVNSSRYPTERVSLQVLIPEGINVQTGGRWIPQTGRRFTYEFRPIDSRTGNHADYPLMLTTQKPGSYEFNYSIKPWGQDQVSGMFTATWE